MHRSMKFLAGGLLMCTVTFAAAQKQDFKLVNKTGLTIEELYLSPVNEDSWGKDVLGRDVLDDGESTDITFSHKADACLWDMKIVDEAKDSVEWEDVNLCKCSVITLRYEKKKPTMECK